MFCFNRAKKALKIAPKPSPRLARIVFLPCTTPTSARFFDAFSKIRYHQLLPPSSSNTSPTMGSHQNPEKSLHKGPKQPCSLHVCWAIGPLFGHFADQRRPPTTSGHLLPPSATTTKCHATLNQPRGHPKRRYKTLA